MSESDDLRLAVCCPDEAARAGIVVRVARAAVEVCLDPGKFRPKPGGREVLTLAGRVPGDVASLLAAGAHVLLVAEPVPDLGALNRFFAAAQSAGVQFVAANPERYLPSRQLVRRQIPDAIGEPGLIRVHRWE